MVILCVGSPCVICVWWPFGPLYGRGGGGGGELGKTEVGACNTWRLNWTRNSQDSGAVGTGYGSFCLVYGISRAVRRQIHVESRLLSSLYNVRRKRDSVLHVVSVLLV